MTGSGPMGRVLLRDVTEDDLPTFFDYQLDQEARRTAAFTSRDPTDRDAFAAHWTRILGDETIHPSTGRWQATS